MEGLNIRIIAIGAGAIAILAGLVMLAFELSGSSEVTVDPKLLAKVKTTVPEAPEARPKTPDQGAAIFKKRRISSSAPDEVEEDQSGGEVTSPSGRIMPSLKPELLSNAVGSKDEAPDLDQRAMDEANHLYDRGDYEGARQAAMEVLRRQPKNVRMNRVVVSSSCILGDADLAERYYGFLPERDQRQMARRCSRYQIEFDQ